MVLMIRKRLVQHFRWHDSGAVSSLEHLQNIMAVALHTPATRHWLPFREYDIYRHFLALGGQIPGNMVARASAHVIDSAPPTGFPHTATVTASNPRRGSYVCPAPDQGNKCDGAIENCRACWDPGVKDVSDWLH